MANLRDLHIEILRVSKRFHTIGSETLYGDNIFDFTTSKTLQDCLQPSILPVVMPNSNLVKHIRMYVSPTEPYTRDWQEFLEGRRMGWHFAALKRLDFLSAYSHRKRRPNFSWPYVVYRDVLENMKAFVRANLTDDDVEVMIETAPSASASEALVGSTSTQTSAVPQESQPDVSLPFRITFPADGDVIEF